MKKSFLYGVIVFLLVSCCCLLIYFLFAKGLNTATATTDSNSENQTCTDKQTVPPKQGGRKATRDSLDLEKVQISYSPPNDISRVMMNYPLPPTMPKRDTTVSDVKMSNDKELDGSTKNDHEYIFKSWVNWPFSVSGVTSDLNPDDVECDQNFHKTSNQGDTTKLIFRNEISRFSTKGTQISNDFKTLHIKNMPRQVHDSDVIVDDEDE